MTESIANSNSTDKLTSFSPYNDDEGQSFNIFKRIFSNDRVSSQFRVSGSCNDLLERNSTSSVIEQFHDHSLSATQTTSSSSTLDTITTTTTITSTLLSNPSTGRNLSSVLKGLKRIIAGKGKTPQAYRDSDFKQYWMPDSNCKECYECGCKFSLFRRRHHCRICGQIFCSACCSQEVPGKTIGYTGSLRCCDYCMKVVNQYIPDVDCTDPGMATSNHHHYHHQPQGGNGSSFATQDDVAVDPTDAGRGIPDGGVNGGNGLITTTCSITNMCCNGAINRLRPSIFDMKKSKNSVELDGSPIINLQKERKALFQESCHLQDLWLSMRSNISMQPIRYILKTYDNCISANQIIDWLINNDKAMSREQAVVLGQALLDGNWLESLDNKVVFRDNPRVFYRPTEVALKLKEKGWQSDPNGSNAFSSLDEINGEPLWVQEILRRSDDDHEVMSVEEKQQVDDHHRPKSPSITGSALHTPNSSFYLSLDSYHSTQNGDDNDNDEKDISDADKMDGYHHDPEVDAPISHQRPLQDCTEPSSMEDDNKERLKNSFHHHLTRLTNQLLKKNQLDLKWAETISAIGQAVTNSVRPNTRLEDEMDIRQYVKIKKIPGGDSCNWQMIDGIVFSKNVSHKKYRTSIDNPRILLLSAPIEYQRVENKMSSLEPQILQEKEFLKKCVHRIVTVRPDVILVEKSVSRIAREYLYEAGITMIVNVKQSVMRRISRMTQATIVSSIDEMVNKYCLGMCRKFYLQSFNQHGSDKTLMFFDGCYPSLGCSIILRGGPHTELIRVKKVLKFIIYAMHHLNFELSFLLDENAYLPRVTSPNQPIGSEKQLITYTNDKKAYEANASIGQEQLTDKQPIRIDEPILNNINRDNMDLLSPIQQNIDPENLNKDKPASKDADLREAKFFNCITKDVILSISPLVSYTLPYLETREGRSSALRVFFTKEDLYWSEELEFCNEKSNWLSKESCDDDDTGSVSNQRYYVDEIMVESSNGVSHPFTFQSLHGSPVKSSIQNLLANFRACGGKTLVVNDSNQSTLIKMHLPTPIDGFTHVDSKKQLDCLDPENHQKISVLFSSLALESQNFPSPCVMPWVVTMNFYSQTDISLGGFLEKFCYNDSYKCVNAKCDVPMRDHVRRFAHGSGCIQVTLKKVEPSAVPQNPGSAGGIKMWSYCKLCLQKTPSSQLSPETYGLSFGKYLELRFHSSNYVNRPGSKCNHSLHRDYVQIFDCGSMRAAFKYSTISILTIHLPPMTITTVPVRFSPDALHEEGIMLNYRIEYLFDSIMENLSKLKRELATSDLHNSIVDRQVIQLESERQSMDQKIEYVLSMARNLKLQNFGQDNSKEHHSLGLQISDAYVGLHRNISAISQTWSEKLADLESSLKKPERFSKNLSTSVASNSAFIAQQQNGPINITLNPSFMMGVQSSPGDVSTSESNPFSMLTNTSNSNNNINKIISQGLRKVSSYPISLAQNKLSTFSAAGELSFSPVNSLATTTDAATIVNGSTIAATTFESEVIESEMSSKLSEENYGGVISSDDCNPLDERDSDAGLGGPWSQMPADQHGDDAKKNTSDANQPNLIAESKDDTKAKMTKMESTSVQVGFTYLSDVVSPLENIHESQVVKLNIVKKARTSCSSKESSMIEMNGDKRVNMKHIFSSFLSTGNVCSITDPIPADEHHLLPECFKVPVAVYDKESSSIIAYALSSNEYSNQVNDMKNNMNGNDSSSKKFMKCVDSDEGKKSSAILSFLKARDKSPNRFDLRITSDEVKPSGIGSFDTVRYVPQDNDSTGDRESISDEPQTLLKNQKPFTATTTTTSTTTTTQHKQEQPHPRTQQQQANQQHIKLQFSDSTTKFYCEVCYAEQFEALRKLIYQDGEESFIRSLSRCVTWFARGGKSGSNFCKTKDNRLILKQMSLKEVQSFNSFAPHYFKYIFDCIETGKPSCMAKIVGVFKVVFQNSKTTETTSQDLIVMENLFYNKQINKIYDLKGSMRNRMVNTLGKSYEDLVLLDENLIRAMVDSPLYVHSHSKLILTSSITRDTEFLANNLIMDYSLVVGVDNNNQLVVGIIDYLRTFTWDKKVEMIFKTTYGSKMPTVVSPEIYRRRFLDAMDRYFLAVPDKWKGLGRSLSEALL